MRFLVPQDEAGWERRRRLLERSRTDPTARAHVDSGRLAEPFWYVDSPLTTPDPARPFPGRPPKGRVPDPAPGVLVPDCPVQVAGQPDVQRLRQLLRRGTTVLLGDDADDAAAGHAAAAVPAPVGVHRMRELGNDVADLLGARPDEAWVVRPDAHVAAVVAPAQRRPLETALRRLLALPLPVAV